MYTYWLCEVVDYEGLVGLLQHGVLSHAIFLKPYAAPDKLYVRFTRRGGGG